ncbi:MAG: hypothetical protein M0R05_04040 [Bacilli bacterium]|nr:hypothetical protein [Bacilli bacterium]MDD4388227.1 hypothetical protein [Bacilli bacterium]
MPVLGREFVLLLLSKGAKVAAIDITKAAVKLLAEGLYSELKDTNVKVIVVFSGGVQPILPLIPECNTISKTPLRKRNLIKS